MQSFRSAFTRDIRPGAAPQRALGSGKPERDWRSPRSRIVASVRSRARATGGASVGRPRHARNCRTAHAHENGDDAQPALARGNWSTSMSNERQQVGPSTRGGHHAGRRLASASGGSRTVQQRRDERFWRQRTEQVEPERSRTGSPRGRVSCVSGCFSLEALAAREFGGGGRRRIVRESLAPSSSGALASRSTS
jgi:hypothetical protein